MLFGAGEEIPGLETVKNPVLDDWLKKVKVYSHDVRIGPDVSDYVQNFKCQKK